MIGVIAYGLLPGLVKIEDRLLGGLAVFGAYLGDDAPMVGQDWVECRQVGGRLLLQCFGDRPVQLGPLGEQQQLINGFLNQDVLECVRRRGFRCFQRGNVQALQIIELCS